MIQIFLILSRKIELITFLLIINKKVLILGSFVFIISTLIYYILFLYLLMSLTQTRADNRTQWIKQDSIEYDFHLILNQGDKFHGLAEISFFLNQNHFPFLPIDFQSKEIHKLQVNQHQIEPNTSEQGFLIIPNDKKNGKHLLHKGKNRITVLYTAQYQTSGEGCVTYTQTVQGKKSQYLYTQFEAYAANLVFPCFDQPNLKAPMKLTIIAPSIWKILSNEFVKTSFEFSEKEHLKHAKIHGHSKHLMPEFLEKIPKEYEGKYTSTIFPETKPLPTYLYCFIAGQYEQISCTLPHNFPFPLTIYSLNSYKPYLQNLSSFIFDVTIQSMIFYQQFFGYEYPFSKFDQVWVHQFKSGAMENAGIVTYNDADLYKETNPTGVQMAELANTITHQLSHHWFGNLVTMKWWDDLWLNQSFADFISYFCLEKIKNKLNYKIQSYMSIFRDRKVWGYQQDERNTTTHSIRAEVENTAATDSIFDGITYSKGGASLQQLMFLIGQDKFSKSLSNYFHRFEWSNASIDDFLQQMNHNFTETQFCLTQWKESWLMKPSLNTYQSIWKQEGNKLSLNVKQGYFTEKYPTLRYHRVQVALFNKQAQIFKTISLLIHPKVDNETQIEVDQQVAAILLNHNDQDYCENLIEERSLVFFQQNISKIQNLLARTVIWYTIRSMTERALYPLHKFRELVGRFIFEQKAQFLFEGILTQLRTSISVNLPCQKRLGESSEIFKLIYAELVSEKKLSEQRANILQNELIQYASSVDEKNILLNWLIGAELYLKKYVVDTSRKWSIAEKVWTLSTLSNDQKKQIFDSIAKGDDSDSKEGEGYVFDAIIADKVHFQELYQKFRTADKTLSTTVKRFIAKGWRNAVHLEWLTTQYKQRYFEDLNQLSGMSEAHYKVFRLNLRPIDDDLEGQIDSYQKVIKQLSEKPDEAGNLKVQIKEINKMIDNLLRRQSNYQFNLKFKA